MKRKLIAALLCLCVMLTLCACGGSAAEHETTPTPTPEPTPEPITGVLYLTVSKLTMSVVGESENIYWGTLPLEVVEWESGDASVVTVENGVVTAVGVGETTVTASYNGERVECTVGCLAENEEALKQLPETTLRSPKRVPPVVSDEPITWYNDSAIVGDSITYIMWQWETKYNYLGDVTFFVRGGVSLNGFVNNYKNIYYKGVETHFENIVADSGVEKVFLMMGQNDLRYRTVEETMDSWETLLGRVLEKSPNVEIYIQSLIPEWTKSNSNNSANEKIVEYNTLLKEYCMANGYHFVDVAPYAVDHTGRMPTTYSLDQSIHMNEEGCYRWMSLLKSYAYLQEN